MKKAIYRNVVACLRALTWAAMIGGCAWASAQSYLVQPTNRRYQPVAVAVGEGVGLGQGIGAEGAQTSTPLAKDDLFAGTEVFAKNATNVTEITMDPDSLDMVGGQDAHRAHNMVLNVVRTYEYDKPGMYNIADVDAIRNKLNTGDWHCSVHERNLKTGESTDICGKRRTDGMSEQVIISVEPKELTFIHRVWRTNGPGSSQLGFFPMLPGLGPTAMIAMTNPEVFADMAIGLRGLPMMLNVEPNLNMQMLKIHPMDEKQMQRLQDQLKNLKVKPFDPDQMNRLNEQMKEFNKEFYKDKEKSAPSAPAPAPQAAPAPEAPQPPQ